MCCTVVCVFYSSVCCGVWLFVCFTLRFVVLYGCCVLRSEACCVVRSVLYGKMWGLVVCGRECVASVFPLAWALQFSLTRLAFVSLGLELELPMVLAKERYCFVCC